MQAPASQDSEPAPQVPQLEVNRRELFNHAVSASLLKQPGRSAHLTQYSCFTGQHNKMAWHLFLVCQCTLWIIHLSLSVVQVSAPAEPEQVASPSSNDQGPESKLDTGPLEGALRQVASPSCMRLPCSQAQDSLQIWTHMFSRCEAVAVSATPGVMTASCSLPSLAVMKANFVRWTSVSNMPSLKVPCLDRSLQIIADWLQACTSTASQ